MFLTSNHYKSIIKTLIKERPDLKGKEVTLPKQGMMAITVIIGREVFKKPKYPNIPILRHKYNDVSFLNTLKDKGLEFVPKLTYTNSNTGIFGMTKMPGEPLTNYIHKLTQKEKHLLADDIATSIIRTTKKLDKKGKAHARHADLHPGNILIDPESKRLTAIIDFGHIEYRREQNLGNLSLRVKFLYNKSNLPKLINQKYKEKTNIIAKKPVSRPIGLIQAAMFKI